MRALFVLLSFVCGLAIPVSALAQPDTLWSARLRFTSGSYTYGPTLYDAIALANGDYAVAGVATLSSSLYSAFFARISPEGQVIWYRTLGGPSSANVAANAVIEMPNGDLYATGYGVYSGNPSMVMLWRLSAAGDSLWYRSHSHTGWTQGNDLALLPDGNIIVTGFCLGTDNQHSDLWLLKCSPTGDTLWTRLLGGTDTDVGNGILVHENGSWYLGGSTKTWGDGDYDAWLAVCNNSGVITSSETAGSDSVDRAYGLCLADSVIYLAGRAGGITSGFSVGYVVKADLTGHIAWGNVITAGQSDQMFRAVTPRTDGGVRCVGWAGTPSVPRPWVADVSASGTLVQSWIYTEFQQGQFYGVTSLPGGGMLICGTITEGNLAKGYVLRVRAGGGLEGVVNDYDLGEGLPGVRVGVAGSSRYAVTDWQGRFRLELAAGTYDVTVSGPCVAHDTTYGVTVVTDSVTTVSLVAARPVYDMPQTSVNLVVNNRIAFTDSLVIFNRGSGEMEFSVVPEPVAPAGDWLSVDPATGVVAPHDSAAVNITILTDAPDNGVYDYYGFLNVRAHSCPDSTDRIPVLVTVLDAPESESSLPAEIALHAAYPNPFNAATRLSFTLPRAATVQLAVFDVTGRLVRTLAAQPYDAGRHELTFDASGLPSGVYLVRFESGSYAATQKLLLLK